MDVHAAKVNKYPQSEIFVATDQGLVRLTLPDPITTDLEFTEEDLKVVAEALILRDETNRSIIEETATLCNLPQFLKNTVPNNDDPSNTPPKTTLNKIDTQLSITSQLNQTSAEKPLNNITVTETNTIDAITVPLNNLNCNVSDSDTSSIIANICSDANSDCFNAKIDSAEIPSMTIEVNKLPAKRRGGWPKGRKRKPDLLHLPPKAPATGYNLYLNEKRKQFKGSNLAFYEITKIIGNKWSTLSLEEKKPYLERAEEDKRRYKEELRVYRQSGSYQLYLAQKRRKRKQNNVLSESDMDATDDIDDEDNEELYCRTCDQWFHNLHNKREHLQGRLHVQAVVGDMRSELSSDDCYVNTSSVSFSASLDESSLEAIPSRTCAEIENSNSIETSVTKSMVNLISVITKRDKDIKSLKIRNEEKKASYSALHQQLCSLKEREATLKDELKMLQNHESTMELTVFHLWQLPSLFVTTELNTSYLETSEYLTDE